MNTRIKEQLPFRQLARHFGLSQNYFTITRKGSKNRYDYMFSFDSDRLQSLNKYLEHVAGLISYLEDKIFEYEDKPKELSLLVYENTDCYKRGSHYQIGSIYHMLSRRVIKIREEKHLFGIQYKVVKKWEKIVKMFKELENE